MITRPVYVRRLIQNENQEWQTNPEGEIGEVLAQTPIPVQGQEGAMQFALMLTVEWSDTHHPALTLEDANFLENVTHLMEDEDDGEESDEHEESEEDSQGSTE